MSGKWGKEGIMWDEECEWSVGGYLNKSRMRDEGWVGWMGKWGDNRGDGNRWEDNDRVNERIKKLT